MANNTVSSTIDLREKSRFSPFSYSYSKPLREGQSPQSAPSTLWSLTSRALSIPRCQQFAAWIEAAAAAVAVVVILFEGGWWGEWRRHLSLFGGGEAAADDEFWCNNVGQRVRSRGISGSRRGEQDVSSPTANPRMTIPGGEIVARWGQSTLSTAVRGGESPS